MVGADLDKEHVGTLGTRDTQYMYSLTLHLGLLGFLLPKTPLIESMNIKDSPDQDFLKYSKACNILAICRIPYLVDNLDVNGPLGLKISAHHFLSGAWRKAAELSQPDFIFTFGGAAEIGPDFFTGDTYAPLSSECLQEGFRYVSPPDIPYHSPCGLSVKRERISDLISVAAPPISAYLQRNFA
jgi:hypothetical protein